jgi:hypothetical protein
MCGLRIGPGLSVRHRGDGVRDSGFPKQPTLRVVNQVTVIGEIHRFADIDTGRPARNISGDTFPTFENVEFIDGRFGLRRGRRRRNRQHYDRGNADTRFYHESPHWRGAENG